MSLYKISNLIFYFAFQLELPLVILIMTGASKHITCIYSISQCDINFNVSLFPVDSWNSYMYNQNAGGQ